MKFNGKRIKEDGKYQKHEAYKISQNRTICFKEEQEDGSVDTVELEISLGENKKLDFREDMPKLIMAKNSSRKMVAIQELKILKDFKNMAFYKGNQNIHMITCCWMNIIFVNLRLVFDLIVDNPNPQE